jgi:hypothetical protein
MRGIILRDRLNGARHRGAEQGLGRRRDQLLFVSLRFGRLHCQSAPRRSQCGEQSYAGIATAMTLKTNRSRTQKSATPSTLSRRKFGSTEPMISRRRGSKFDVEP